MKLLEYEAKTLLSHYPLPLPASRLVNSKHDMLPLPIVLKSQVHTGGRGKAGGIKIVSDPNELESTINQLFNLPIKGFLPTTLLAEELITIKQEYYLSLVINRASAQTELVAHTNGGVEVEENERDTFLRLPITRDSTAAAGEQLAEYYDLPEHSFTLQETVKNLLICFIESDATLTEINPLILTAKQEFVIGDCKMELDDAATFRHPNWDFEEKVADVNFVTINPNGEVATIANGAGLGMATVDAVAEAKLSPANFLDIGGGATSESVLEAFRKIMEYPNIKAIVINIFAGITRCDEVARAIITAKQQIPTLPPLSIRLAGTNFEQAVELLAKEKIGTFETLEECLAAVHEVTNG